MHMYIYRVAQPHTCSPTTSQSQSRRAPRERRGSVWVRLHSDGAGMHPTGQPRVSRSRSLSIPATSSWARLMSEAAPPGSLRLLEEGALAGVVCRASPAPIGSHGLFAPDSGVPILSIAAVS